MKKKKILIIILLGLTILVYFGYKGHNYFKYKSENISDNNYDEFMDSFEVHEDITISTKEILEVDYLVFENVKIKNDFQEYQLERRTNNYIVYNLYNDKGKIISVFRITIEDTNIDDILNVDSALSKKDKERFLKKYNINNDLDLLDYVLEEHKVNNTLFTSVKNMKYHYITEYLTYTTLNNSSYVTKINGDYEGYILGDGIFQGMTNINNVNILKDNKKYQFSFWMDEKFTEQYIKEMIETIVIN